MSVESARPIYSVTALSTYERCPWEYYITFVRRVPPPRSQAREIGTSIHALIEDHLRHPRLIPLDVPEDLAPLFASFESSRFNTTPLLLEAKFTAVFTAADVRGRIDCVFERESGEFEVVDFKSGTPRSEEEAGEQIQLPVYALAVRERFHVPARQVAWTYFYLKSRTEVRRDGDDEIFEALRDRVDGVVSAIQAGQFDSRPGCGCWACRRWPPRKAPSD